MAKSLYKKIIIIFNLEIGTKIIIYVIMCARCTACLGKEKAEQRKSFNGMLYLFYFLLSI